MVSNSRYLRNITSAYSLHTFFSPVLAADSIQEVKDEEKYNKLTKDEPVWFLHKKEGDSDKLGTPFSNAAKEHQHILTFGDGILGARPAWPPSPHEWTTRPLRQF